MPPNNGPHRAVVCALVIYFALVAILLFVLGREFLMPAGAMFLYLTAATTVSGVAARLCIKDWSWIRHFATLAVLLAIVHHVANPEFMGVGPAELRIRERFNRLVGTYGEGQARRLERMYTNLKAERANLKPADPAALAAYNKHLAEYEAFHKQVEMEKAARK